jgi:hypothetical protein
MISQSISCTFQPQKQYTNLNKTIYMLKYQHE